MHAGIGLGKIELNMEGGGSGKVLVFYTDAHSINLSSADMLQIEELIDYVGASLSPLWWN